MSTPGQPLKILSGTEVAKRGHAGTRISPDIIPSSGSTDLAQREPMLRLKTAFMPMEARTVDEIPTDDGWQYEPKWDGFRCLAFRDGAKVQLQSKSGHPLERYFPESRKAWSKGSTVPPFRRDSANVHQQRLR